jgi:Polyketide cyclase / dehydrase and lipid transport
MKLRVERTVPFPPDLVYGWWTDFREDDHREDGVPSRARRTIVRRDGEQVWMRDRATRPAPVTIDEHVVLQPRRGYTVTARYPAANVRYEYQFEPVIGGTRIELSAEIYPRHMGRLFLPLFRGRVIRYAERDTDFHLRKMVRDLTHPAPDPGQPR